MEILKDCCLCPRKCHADRTAGKTGYCGMDQTVRVARAALHMWEEPCISGRRGSGAVFFTGCNLRCCFCQNRDIAIGDSGLEITINRLAEISGTSGERSRQYKSGDRNTLYSTDYCRIENCKGKGSESSCCL